MAQKSARHLEGAESETSLKDIDIFYPSSTHRHSVQIIYSPNYNAFGLKYRLLRRKPNISY